MSDLEKFRTRWYRWLGQKTRAGKPYWTTLLKGNWSSWAGKTYFKNNVDPDPYDWTRESVKEYYKEAIKLADMNDLLKLDNIYCTEIIGSR